MTANLDGETLLYPILGDPIAQVKSPGLLSAILARRGVNGLVVPMHVAAVDYPAVIGALKATGNVRGLIATVPHKGATLALCDAPSERARFAGSINVMHRRDDGTWEGDNTDGQGFLNGVAAKGFDIAGTRALLIGVGGAGAAIAYEILARGAAFLAIHDLDAGRRNATIARLEAAFPGRVGAGGTDPRGFDFVGNATPVGMRPDDPLPVEAEHYEPRQFVADCITRPAETPQLRIAHERGCGTMPGLGMFEAQAELLVDRVTGRTGEPPATDAA